MIKLPGDYDLTDPRPVGGHVLPDVVLPARVHPERQQDPFDTPQQWKNFEALERRLGEIESAVAELRVAMGDVKNNEEMFADQLREIEVRLAKLEAAAPMTKRLGEIEHQLANADSRFGMLGGLVHELGLEVEEMRNELRASYRGK